jgi:hypothetical protein
MFSLLSGDRIPADAIGKRMRYLGFCLPSSHILFLQGNSTRQGLLQTMRFGLAAIPAASVFPDETPQHLCPPGNYGPRIVEEE